jgi:hypothetical protein
MRISGDVLKRGLSELAYLDIGNLASRETTSYKSSLEQYNNKRVVHIADLFKLRLLFLILRSPSKTSSAFGWIVRGILV